MIFLFFYSYDIKKSLFNLVSANKYFIKIIDEIFLFDDLFIKE